MAHAYTPGLKVLHKTKINKERRLPLKGIVIVEKGATVSPDDIVAKTDLPGNVQMVNVANSLNIDAQDIREAMQVKEGAQVTQGQQIAEVKGLFGLFKSKVESPVDGTVEVISDSTGQVVLREPPIPVAIDAYISGQIQDVFPEEGVVIESKGVFIQGIFGIGGESRGNIVVVTDDREGEITENVITSDLEGKIIVGGSFISLAAYKKAIQMQVAGVVVGGFNYFDLEDILGYKLGVAITGSEDMVSSLIVTEGYGKIRMGHRTFELLKKHGGKFASINGATQIRAGVIRPEIVIPLSQDQPRGNKQDADTSTGIQEGRLVRVIRAPHFGRMGRVVELPPELRQMESETMVRVAIVEIDGKNCEIPRSNLEMLETN